LVSNYEGLRPKSLDIFLDYVGLDEEQFNEIVDRHQVDPWGDKVFLKLGKKPHDFDKWRRKDGLSPETVELTLHRLKKSD
jgi:hypothetical protein